MKFILISLFAFLFTACASHSGVVAIGKDTFMVAKQAATGFPGLGNLKAEIISEGASHCTKLGKHFQLVGTQETKPPYILGNYPRSEIQFMCLDSVDQEFQRPKLQTSPDTVIEIRK